MPPSRALLPCCGSEGGVLFAACIGRRGARSATGSGRGAPRRARTSAGRRGAASPSRPPGCCRAPSRGRAPLGVQALAVGRGARLAHACWHAASAPLASKGRVRACMSVAGRSAPICRRCVATRVALLRHAVAPASEAASAPLLGARQLTTGSRTIGSGARSWLVTTARTVLVPRTGCPVSKPTNDREMALSGLANIPSLRLERRTLDTPGGGGVSGQSSP